MPRMRLMTPDFLVDAITELSKEGLLVRATQVFDWCEPNAVDYQGSGLNNQAVWDADCNEARGQHRLLKFKHGAKRQSPVAWALATCATQARYAAGNEGWRELDWDGDNWVWREDDGT